VNGRLYVWHDASIVTPRKPEPEASRHWATVPVFALLLVCGLGYAVYGLVTDIHISGQSPLAIGAFVLLGVALLIALDFEFVNGFHDTANAVTTVSSAYPRSKERPAPG
jgi:PiT family inorganic phosphate transporter